MENRLRKVRDILKVEKLDALLVSSSYNIRYLTGFDGFGTHEREGYVLLTKTNLYIVTDPRLSEGARKNSRSAEVIEYSSEKKLLPQLQEIIYREKIEMVGFEENLTYAEYRRFKKLKVKLKMTEEIIEFVRRTKDINEIKSLQKACKLTDDCYSHILKNIRIGESELEVAWKMEKYIRDNGGELAFPSIVAFGENSAIPHHLTTNQELQTNNIILLDFGAKVDEFCSDMTRTVFFGKADDKFKKIYEAVKEAQQLPFNILRASINESRSHKKKSSTSSNSISPHQIDALARDYIMGQDYPSVPHSVGHGVGLEVHELPHISPGFKDELEPNTVFTIEPGIYINGYGGVRIEDTVWFDGSKITTLTKSRKELIEL